ncbi:hypothetical protein BCU63_01620 [Vibrio splendidus]|nr:hypothetical protein BCU63_01620 [Vibrio splendidus]
MKKVLLLTVLTASFSAHAAHKIIYAQGIFGLVQFSDEFTEEVTSCQLNIGDIAKDKPRISLFSKPGTDLSSIGISSYAGSFGGSGYQFKIDNGEVVKRGSTYAGGDTVFGNISASKLDELASGNKLILRVHPDNQYADSQTATYSLAGSTVAINKFKSCLAGS